MRPRRQLQSGDDVIDRGDHVLSAGEPSLRLRREQPSEQFALQIEQLGLALNSLQQAAQALGLRGAAVRVGAGDDAGSEGPEEEPVRLERVG